MPTSFQLLHDIRALAKVTYCFTTAKPSHQLLAETRSVEMNSLNEVSLPNVGQSLEDRHIYSEEKCDPEYRQLLLGIFVPRRSIDVELGNVLAPIRCQPTLRSE
jgi:hypothetical protein